MSRSTWMQQTRTKLSLQIPKSARRMVQLTVYGIEKAIHFRLDPVHLTFFKKIWRNTALSSCISLKIRAKREVSVTMASAAITALKSVTMACKMIRCVFLPILEYYLINWNRFWLEIEGKSSVKIFRTLGILSVDFRIKKIFFEFFFGRIFVLEEFYFQTKQFWSKTKLCCIQIPGNIRIRNSRVQWSSFISIDERFIHGSSRLQFNHLRWHAIWQFVRQTSFSTANLQSLQFREIALANGTSGQLYGNYAKQFDQWIDAADTNEFPVWYVSIILRVRPVFKVCMDVSVSPFVQKICEIGSDEFIELIDMTIIFYRYFRLKSDQNGKNAVDLQLNVPKSNLLTFAIYARDYTKDTTTTSTAQSKSDIFTWVLNWRWVLSSTQDWLRYFYNFFHKNCL